MRARINTGDVVLSSGSSKFAKVLKELYGVKFSHAAVAVWGDDIGLEKYRLYLWEATGNGVGEVEFAEGCVTKNVTYFSRIVNPGAGDVAIRQLSARRTPDIVARIREHCDRYRGVVYETSKLEMLAAVPWVRALPVVPSHGDLATQFCYEAAAAFLQAAGWLASDRPACNYNILDFLGDDMPWVDANLCPLVPLTF